MLEVSRADISESDDDDGIELSLDLSIGGSYGKSQKNEVLSINEKRGQEVKVPSSGFSFTETSSGNEMERNSKREIQALRRQEARRKRKEKMRKFEDANAISRGILPNGSAFCLGVGNANDRLQLKAKAHENEMTKNEGVYLKKERIAEVVGNDFVRESMEEEESSSRSGKGSQKLISKGSLETSSLVASDHRSASEKGGKSIEVRSDSNHLKARGLLFHALATSGPSDLPNENDASPYSREVDQAKRIRADQSVQRGLSIDSQYSSDEAAGGSRPGVHPPKARKTTSTSKASSIVKPNNKVPSNPPTLDGGNHGLASLPTMPCVSTTGNGPNGKTVTGFLHRYSKSEVSIICVCHGKSHTPSEFVEHAGGVDVSNPLRHITMIPSSFR